MTRGPAGPGYADRMSILHPKVVPLLVGGFAMVIFLMLATGGDVSLHDAEMEDVRWFPLRTAIKRAAYRGERDVIRRAAERLE